MGTPRAVRRGRAPVVFGLVVALVAGCTTATPPARPPAPRAVPPPAPPRPPAVLSPQAPPEEERRLTRLTNENLASTERLLEQIDGHPLSAEQRDREQTIRSFVAKAREALGASDVARASTLADKARVLAEELARNVR